MNGAGKEFTVTVTLWLLLQPVEVIVSFTVYVVVKEGITVGLASVEVNPTDRYPRVSATRIGCTTKFSVLTLEYRSVWSGHGRGQRIDN